MDIKYDIGHVIAISHNQRCQVRGGEVFFILLLEMINAPLLKNSYVFF